MNEEQYRDGFGLGVRYATYASSILLNAIKLDLSIERVRKLKFAPLQKVLDVEQRVYENYSHSNRLYKKAINSLSRAESRGAQIKTRKRNIDRTMAEYQEIHRDVTYLIANLIKEKQEKQIRARRN